MVAYRSFGSQRAPVAMRETYLGPGPDDPLAAARARTRSGWAVVEQLFPGRVYDHLCEIPLVDKSYPESLEVWLGEFGDTVVCMVPSTAEYRRMRHDVGADRPVRAELVVDEGVTLSYVDGEVERFVAVAPDATRGAVRGASRGAPLPFEEPFLDGPDDEVFPLAQYLPQARSWLFGVNGYPPSRQVPPAATEVRGYVLGPADGPLPLAGGLPLTELPHPDELATQLAEAELLDERGGRYTGGGGDWFQLHRVDAERALLVGCDVEDTETYFAAAVSVFGQDEETDLLAGVPQWWKDFVHAQHPGAFLTDGGFDPINILCGWDGRQWTKAVGAPDPVLLHSFLDPDDEY